MKKSFLFLYFFLLSFSFVLLPELSLAACTDNSECESFQECCGNNCVNLNTNPLNCSSCGNVCSPVEYCIGGSCVCVSEGGSFEICSAYETCVLGTGCVDLQTDPFNCGAGGQACGPGESCIDGSCRCGSTTASPGSSACADEEACCGSPASCQPADECACGTVTCADGQECCEINGIPVCTNLDSNQLNCGSCGNTCSGDLSCLVGDCTCPDGFSQCSDECVDLANDSNNCGNCNNACPAGEKCNGSGVCELFCLPGEITCAGKCVDLNTDRNNCGTCGRSCGSGYICEGGEFVLSCQSGRVDCSGQCVDLNTDVENCGTCGHSCDPGEICDGYGECTLSCQFGRVDCSGQCVDLSTDVENCGTCGRSCDPGEICDGSGVCTLSCPPGQGDCGGKCVDLATDVNDCGTCGRACGLNEICDDGVCQLSCPSATEDCGGVCLDTGTDRNSCGSCGITCLSNELCTDGNCEAVKWNPQAMAPVLFLPYWSTSSSTSTIRVFSARSTSFALQLFDDLGDLIFQQTFTAPTNQLKEISINSLVGNSKEGSALIVGEYINPNPPPLEGYRSPEALLGAESVIFLDKLSITLSIPHINARDGVWTTFSNISLTSFADISQDLLFLSSPARELAENLLLHGALSEIPTDDFSEELLVNIIDRNGQLIFENSFATSSTQLFQLSQQDIAPYGGGGTIVVGSPNGAGAFTAFMVRYSGTGVTSGYVMAATGDIDPIKPTAAVINCTVEQMALYYGTEVVGQESVVCDLDDDGDVDGVDVAILSGVQ